MREKKGKQVRKLKKKNSIIDVTLVLTLFMVFTLCSLLVIVLGARVYKSTVGNIEQSFSSRTALTFVTKKIRQSAGEEIFLGVIEDTEAIIIREQIEEQDCITYLYYYDGYLYEQFALESANVSLESGQRLLSLEQFSCVEMNHALTIEAVGKDQKKLSTVINIG